LVLPPLELAHVGIGHVGHRGQLAEREIGELALRAQETAETLSLLLPEIVG
jgi:hypothetical protein